MGESTVITGVDGAAVARFEDHLELVIKEGKFKKLHGGAFGKKAQTRDLKLNSEGVLLYYDGKTVKGQI